MQDEDQNNPLSRFSSISSTATAPNLPGAGRTVGLILDWVGSGLESFVGKRIAKPNLKAEAAAQDANHSHFTASNLEDFNRQQTLPHDKQITPSSSSSVSSTATAPNLVGPGRTLGLLFDWLGEGLEGKLNKRATQLNLGPEAIARDIRRLRRHEQIDAFVRYAAPYAHVNKAKEKKVRKLCKNLMKYARLVFKFRIILDHIIYEKLVLMFWRLS